MRYICVLFCVGCLVFSCRSMPKLNPVDDSGQFAYQERCCRPFPEGKWQFLHSIEATLPSGKKSVIMGVTIISSPERSIHCILMTIDGLVVFDARFNGKIQINRGIPPFDSKEFAWGLLKDIKLIFFKPEIPMNRFGVLKNNILVCRYGNSGKPAVDILSHGDGSWEIMAYGKGGRLVRSAKGIFLEKPDAVNQSSHHGFPNRIQLKAHDASGYSLTLDLVEAVLVTHQR